MREAGSGQRAKRDRATEVITVSTAPYRRALDGPLGMLTDDVKVLARVQDLLAERCEKTGEPPRRDCVAALPERVVEVGLRRAAISRLQERAQ